jgi:hypothetical protein
MLKRADNITFVLSTLQIVFYTGGPAPKLSQDGVNVKGELFPDEYQSISRVAVGVLYSLPGVGPE